MAAPPKLKGLSPEQLPADARRWVEQYLVTPLNQGFIAPVAAALSRGLTFSENFAAQLHDFSIQVPDDWVEVDTFLNAWVNRGGSDFPAAYRKTADGMVEIRGSIKDGTINTAAFTLPAAYWPAGRFHFANVSNSLFGASYVDHSNGQVVPFVGDATWFDFVGVRYPAADRSPVPAACWPYVFKSELRGKAVGVLALDAQPDDESFQGPAGFVDFTDLGDGRIRINNIPGLVPGKRHNLRLLVLGG